jgi:FtsH-binding integral membrane protein
MSYMQDNPYRSSDYAGGIAAYAEETVRAAFIRRTYIHLLAAIFAFAGLEAMFFMLIDAPTQARIVQAMFGGKFGALLLVGAFVGVSWLAQTWASSSTSQAMQYLGLSTYVVLEAVIFIPILFVANRVAPSSIPSAAIVTAVVFGGLTAMVFVTRADFSWRGKILWVGGLAAIGVIVCSMLFGVSLGVFFTGAMIALACGYIVYDTSNVMHHYQTTQHVAAALALFASVATLFYYILRLFISSRDN